MIRKIIAADPEGKTIAGMTTSVTQVLDSFFMPYAVPLGMGDGPRILTQSSNFLSGLV